MGYYVERPRNRHNKKDVQLLWGHDRWYPQSSEAAARKPSVRLPNSKFLRVERPEKPRGVGRKKMPDSKFLRALGTEDVQTTPPQTSVSLRAAEEWERCICENQAFSILHQAQEGRQELIKKMVEKC